MSRMSRLKKLEEELRLELNKATLLLAVLKENLPRRLGKKAELRYLESGKKTPRESAFQAIERLEEIIGDISIKLQYLLHEVESVRREERRGNK